jgi:hypothetical protein
MIANDIVDSILESIDGVTEIPSLSRLLSTS